ncbi:YkgJ family cysteine cluster protein [Pectobacteriaceae bacterium CE70]|uniref:YkgJ family cysteine cluster protein n=1 Tax=Serratia sp. (strain ATCC 39006) TaxID=104623 RepID=A0A2I5T9G4_SERS3|nr:MULTISPECIES: YkgJ family cysteine cluster protein [Enterobacterales]WJV64177.1 YkgJ family cysteine cluster protein [Pectobacteriaceae bacterium C52]WJV65393.1 YkgJ family cysteine cluster protein [Pectobacteriaceae bacterium CE70]WJY09409.1 YkgJ family cysteine cluster protein [Pectobacteriaceae bacterium C80]AUH01211.1 YkgJ family cysteine cluster protein [Serratia sp. ATCC 39006]AUH05531.1 YkgJ family cysteine cluster protein [Serratia sp. ATCC 39006]
MNCRPDCGACCIAPSISSPIPGMPQGKPANTRCIHLDEQMRCALFHSPLRPAVCGSLQASLEMCHSHRDDALIYLIQLEVDTTPDDQTSLIRHKQ